MLFVLAALCYVRCLRCCFFFWGGGCVSMVCFWFCFYGLFLIADLFFFVLLICSVVVLCLLFVLSLFVACCSFGASPLFCYTCCVLIIKRCVEFVLLL